MAVKFSVGGEFFEKIRENGAYYVDKTELLYDLVNHAENEVTLFTRPRRFGKTLTMTMIESFFDIRRSSRELFEGLRITEHEDFCREWMNQYPVLFITLKDVEGLTLEGACGMLKSALSSLYKKHVYLRESREVIDEDKVVFNRIISQAGKTEDIKNSLLTLMRMMHSAYGKPVILLVDEYDVPIAKAQENGYYREMTDLIRGIMSTALKTNDFLKFAVVTGCLRIAKESIFTGVNNFASYSILSDDFSQYFGFTQEEVEELLTAAGRREKAGVFKEWYDGYHFGSSSVYCPWDVVSYASALVRREDARPENYWKNTSSNSILRDFIFRADLDVSGKFEALMNGGTICQTVSEELTYDSLYDNEDNIWSVLLMTGYLTKAEAETAGKNLEIKIPNREIASIFEDSVVALFRTGIDRNRQAQLMKALWDGDEDGATHAISDFLWETISYHNYHEDFYQAFLAGIFTGIGYGVKTDHEQGLGRTDITLLDKKNRRALILEAKKSDSEKDMEKDCRAANAQILRKKYADDLAGFRQVRCYGISFFKKSALVKCTDIGNLEEMR